MTVAIPTEGPYHPLVVSRVVRETADACSLVLEVPERLRELFEYESGQFLTFRFPVDGKRLVRCYSLASSPVSDGEHKVTIKRILTGRVSNHVNDAVKPGDTLEVMKPAGHFCLQERTTPVVLFSGGSGITPVISIIKTALATSERSLRLLYANRDRDAIIFRAELDALAAAHGERLQIHHSLDAVDGFVDVERARAFAAGQPEADFYICGPGPYMDVVEEALAKLDVPEEQIFIERFELAEAEEEPTGAADALAASAVAAGAAPRATIVLDGNRTEIELKPGETILAAARRAGLEPPFACEEAYCGCCMARVAEGQVDMKMNDGGIDQGQIDQGWVLTCQGVPQSPEVVIEYPD